MISGHHYALILDQRVTVICGMCSWTLQARSGGTYPVAAAKSYMCERENKMRNWNFSLPVLHRVNSGPTQWETLEAPEMTPKRPCRK